MLLNHLIAFPRCSASMMARTGVLIALLSTVSLTACGSDRLEPTALRPREADLAKVPTGPAVTITPLTPSILVGATVQLTATVTGGRGPNAELITWATSSSAVAQVSATGLVTGVSPGTATITATSGTGKKAATGSTMVTVVAPMTSSLNTTIGWDGARQIGMFGGSDFSTVFGQSFTAPSATPVLHGFSFWLNGSSPIVFAAYVMAWDGAKATGPVLWKSSQYAAPTTPMQRFDFAVPALALIPGAQYIAFISTLEYLGQQPADAGVLMGYVYNPYAGGRFFQLFQATSMERLTESAWDLDLGGDFDAAFIATFSN